MKKSSLKYSGRLLVAGLYILLLTGGSVIAIAQTKNFNTGAAAPQDGVAAAAGVDETQGGQQLPSNFADQQIPRNLATGDEPSILQPASDQIIPTPDQQAAAAATGQSGASDEGKSMVQQPSDVPAQPETRKLVPATAMGAAAQSVENGTNDGAVPNPVEDAAAAADRDFAAQQELEASQQPPAIPPGVLDDYARESGDALPAVDNSTMVRLEGDFPNSNRNVSVEMNNEMSAEEKKALQDGIREEAFDAAITGMFPLSPEQIKSLLGKYDETQKAVETPPYDSPKPEISVQNVSLDPGVLPATIKTAVGNVTTLNILDATGAPWPVQDVTWAGDFEVVEPEEGGHIIRITPVAQHARGNIVIRLLTLKTPLTMTLTTGRDVVQYRVDARVPEYGPFAQAPLMQGGKSMVAGDSTLTTLLDGVAPGGAVKLSVAGVDGRTTAYAMNGSTYVRTPLTLLSPAWQSSVSSADGMNVYVLSSAPVLLLSDEGEFMRATLQEKEDLLDE